jgi:hypothetical protein
MSEDLHKASGVLSKRDPGLGRDQREHNAGYNTVMSCSDIFAGQAP